MCKMAESMTKISGKKYKKQFWPFNNSMDQLGAILLPKQNSTSTYKI